MLIQGTVHGDDHAVRRDLDAHADHHRGAEAREGRHGQRAALPLRGAGNALARAARGAAHLAEAGRGGPWPGTKTPSKI